MQRDALLRMADHSSTWELTIASVSPTTSRVDAIFVNTSAFLGTNPADEPIASGLPVTGEELRIPSCQGVTSTKSRLFDQALHGTSAARDDDGHPRNRSFSYLGIELRVDSKPSHSVYECSSADTQSDCSAIRTADAALACGKRLYDFLALLPFVLLSASVDIRS